MLQPNFTVFIVVLLAASAATAPVNNVQIDRYNFKSLDAQNEYSFNYRLSDGQARDETGSLTTDANGNEKYVVYGSYQYIGPDNVEYTIFYTADENGFQPYGPHLPGVNGLDIQSTPVPVLDLSPNVIASLVG